MRNLNPVTPIGPLATQTVTITAGTSLSPAVDLGVYDRLVAIQMPSAWTAANLTFQASADGVTYVDVYDASGERTVTAAASRFLALDPDGWGGIRYLKLRSGTSATPVNQAADRVLTLVTRPW